MDNPIKTKLSDFTLRFAKEKDSNTILAFIKALAEYENMTEDVVATEDLLKVSLFEKKAAEVIIGEFQGKPVCFALFFHNFSTFLGKPGIYLEDIFVLPEARGKGIGKIIFSFLASLAVQRGCTRLEWSCLDWNKPSINFYKRQGGVPMDGWTVYRACDEALIRLAKQNELLGDI